MMGTPLEHCNFSSNSIFPCSALLRATIIGTALEHFPVPTERSGTLLTMMGTPHHLNIAISLAIQYFPAPLRSVPQSLVQALEHFPVPKEWSGMLLTMMGTPLNIAISVAIQYFPAPLRSVPQSLVQALEHFPVPMERSGTLLTMMGTPLEHCNFSSHSIFPCSTPLRATIIGTST
jgi:hypothetical protein